MTRRYKGQYKKENGFWIRLWDVILDLGWRLSILYVFLLIYFYFTNRAIFWRRSIYGFIVLLVFVFITILLNKIEERKQQKWLMSQKILQDIISKLRPEEFEDYIGLLLKKLGYEKVNVIGGIHQADGGFDVKAERDNQVYYIQVKKYGLHRPVRVEQVRAFYGALKADHPEAKGIFITTSFFTHGFFYTSETFAKKAGVELVDGKKLLEMIEAANQSTVFIPKSGT